LIEDNETHRRVCPKCKVEYDVKIKVLTDTSVQMDWWPVAKDQDESQSGSCEVRASHTG